MTIHLISTVHQAAQCGMKVTIMEIFKCIKKSFNDDDLKNYDVVLIENDSLEIDGAKSFKTINYKSEYSNIKHINYHLKLMIKNESHL